MDPELEEQMKMLEGLDLDTTPAETIAPAQPVQQVPVSPITGTPMETAETLRGEAPSPVGVPFTPENPTNAGVVTNTVVNQQAAAQVVQQTTTNFVPQQQIANQPIQNVAPAPAQPAPQAEVVDLNSAPVFVNLGESTHQTKTDFLKLKENEFTRVTLVNYNATGVHFHYENGLGYFKCLSTYDDPSSDWPTSKAVCCLQPNPSDPTKLVGRGKTKIFLPVIEYPVSHTDGKTLITGATPKLKVLALSNQEFQTLFEVQNEYGTDTSTFDLSISRKKSERGGFLEYKLTPGPSWRAKFADAIAQEAAKITNETYNLAREEFARTLTEERVKQFYEEKIKQDIAAQQIANQQIPDANMINLNM